jgi:uncharacterized protein (DUF2235 family)
MVSVQVLVLRLPLLIIDYRDTVSSVGIVRSKSLPLTDQTDHVCFFRHALALDERRVKFLPEYAHGGVLDKNRVNDTKTDVKNSYSHDRIKEVWFPGTHSDMCVSPLLGFPS